MKDIKLKPCPFCGSDGASFSVEPTGYVDKSHVYISCNICPAQMVNAAFNDNGLYGVDNIKKDMLKDWNMRTP